MATIKAGVPGVGAAWAYALNLWEQYVAGTYTTWAYTMASLNTGRAIKVTVGLVAGGTDVHWIQPFDSVTGETMTLQTIFDSPGWRTMPQQVLPNTTPDAIGVDIAYLNGPFALRKDICGTWGNATVVQAHNWEISLSDIGEQSIYVFITYRVNTSFFDVTGILWSNAGLFTTIAAQATDLIGAAPVFVQSSGGSVDLGPVVTALQDISMIDVDYTCNNGQNTVSVRGKVRT